MHSLKNDVSGDVFPAQQRFSRGDVVADIILIPDLSGEENSDPWNPLKELRDLFTLEDQAAPLVHQCQNHIFLWGT